MESTGYLDGCAFYIENTKIRKADSVGRYCVAYFRFTLDFISWARL